MFRVALGCAASILLVTGFHAWSSFTSPPMVRASVNINARIERLVRYNQHLQHKLAAAAPTEPIECSVAAPVLGTHQDQDASAYVFYATSDPYACSVLVNIQRLHALNTSLAMHVLISSDVSRPYVEALRAANVEIHVQTPPALAGGQGGYYQDCLLKLLAFKMHVLAPGLRRILVLDADQLILKNMDTLFDSLPEVDLAAPRAYWLSKDFLASTWMMITLSNRLWDTVQTALAAVESNKFDMDLINDLLGHKVLMLPGTYVTLNSHWEDWNLPSWYSPVATINWKTVDAVNKLVKSQGIMRKITAISKGGTQDKRQIGDDEGREETSPPSDGALYTDSTTSGMSLMAAHPAQKEAAAVSLPLPSPRFPDGHPLTQELYRLHHSATVLHFSALGKPWVHNSASVRLLRPDSHPLLAGQVEMWREVARDVCPGGLQVTSASVSY